MFTPWHELLTRYPLRRFPEAWLCALVTLGCLGFRVATGRLEGEGLIFQLWAGALGTLVLGATMPALPGRLRGVADGLVVPLLLAVALGALRYAIQALLPVLFLTGILLYALWLLGRRHFWLAALVLVVLGYFAPAIVKVARHLAWIETVWRLTPDQVRTTTLDEESPGIRQRMMWGMRMDGQPSREDVDRNQAVTRALATVRPLQQVGRLPASSWQLVLELTSGKSVGATVIMGTPRHPQAAVITDGVGGYESRALYEVLRRYGVPE
jgi:hypothetical protein